MARTALNSLRLTALALAVAGSLVALSARAADVDAAPATGQPERGAHMASVEQHFGAPAQRYAAVGQPPITRWDYPTMVVYFEGDLVLHTVLVNPGT
jgi:hypothetical protein